ncbi:MAG: TonB-dependent receptor, partial [Elusimicrobiota bacterium]
GSLAMPSIRGFSGRQILVVVDDVPQLPDYTGDVDLSRFPLDNVDRIEILRGGASAVYGPNAEGGVIQIITKRPISAVDVLAASDVGSFDTLHNRVRVGSQQGPVEAQASASRDLSDGFQQNSSYRNTNLAGFFAYDAKKLGKLSYSIEGAKGSIGLPSGTPVPIGDWDGELERQANDLTAYQTETNRNNRLQYLNRIRGIDLTARVANNVKDLDTFQFGAETMTRTEGRNAFGKLECPGRGALGYEFYQNRLDSNVYGVYRTNAWGTFYEAYFIRNAWLKFTPGIRYDRDNSYGESWSPRVELVVTPGEMWKMSASANRSFHAPTLADQFNPYVPSEFQPGHLNPEITWSYNLGATVKPMPGLETTVNLFHTETKDRIALKPVEVSTSVTYYPAFNLNRAFTRGVEAALSYAYKGVRQKLAYSYLQAEGENAENGNFDFRSLAFCPKHKIDYRADVRLPRQSGLTFDVHYVYKQWSAIGETGVEIPDYVVANIKATKKIGWLDLFVACSNLLDRHYAENADSFNGYFPQPGRTFSGGVTVHFWMAGQ